MPAGTHWEWRGFGATSDSFKSKFDSYKLRYPNKPAVDKTEDAYVWVPGSPINVKLRRGGDEQGLKLKRFIEADRDIELWLEDRRELYPFEQMDAKVLSTLASALGIRMAGVPPNPQTPDSVEALLRGATPPCSIVKIVKLRETHVFSERVQVEFARIENVFFDDAALPNPEPISIAVENSSDLTGRPREEVARAREEVESAVTALQLRNEPLNAMNYLRAITKWQTALSTM